MLAVKAESYGVHIINPALSLLKKQRGVSRAKKFPISRPFIVTTRVIHLPKRTETSLTIESDRDGPNHRIGPVCTGRA